MTGTERRNELIQGLRDLAAFLEKHPDVPVGEFPSVSLTYYPDGTDAEKLAEVERIADLLGVEATTLRTQRHAKIAFGRVDYHATFISDSDQRDWRELMEIGEQRKADRVSTS